MAGVNDKDLKPQGPWPAGIDNVHKETNLLRAQGKYGPGPIIALREAVNLDLSEDGWPTTRRGTTKVLDCTMGHSLFHDGAFPYALFCDGDTMFATDFGGTPATVLGGMALRDVAYRLIGDRVYWSNGRKTGIVRPDGTPADWGPETPEGVPTLTAVAGGMTAGVYQVLVNFIDINGEQGGAPDLAAKIVLTDGQGIGLADIAQPVSGNVVACRISVTPPNGDVFYQHKDIAVGVATTTVIQNKRGPQLRTQGWEPMPAGDFVDALGHRTYTAIDNEISWSQAGWYGLTYRAEDRMTVGKNITLMNAIADGSDGAGMFVADHKRTYWRGGFDPHKATTKVVYPHAAIKGSAVRVPGSMFGLETTEDVIYWIAANGVACLGLPGGLVTPLREDQVVAPGARGAASLYRDQDGLRQVITALKGGVPQGAGFRDSVAAKVYPAAEE